MDVPLVATVQPLPTLSGVMGSYQPFLRGDFDQARDGTPVVLSTANRLSASGRFSPESHRLTVGSDRFTRPARARCVIALRSRCWRRSLCPSDRTIRRRLLTLSVP